MRWLFPGDPRPVYTRASFFELTLAHMELVAVSSLAAAAIGIGLGIFVTRERGREFAAMTGSIAATGQTFPPVAVLALTIPILGYGAAPAIVALAVYAIFPIVTATVTGIAAVPVTVREAARAMGFAPRMSYGKSSCRSPFPSFWPVFARRSSSTSERRQSDRLLALYRSARPSSRDYRHQIQLMSWRAQPPSLCLPWPWIAGLPGSRTARVLARPSRNGSRPLIGPLAQIGNEAALAFRAPRLADVASMQDQPMMRM